MKHTDLNASKAFVETFELPPYATGSLTGLSFAVKDVMDVAGYKTGCGNPDWLAEQQKAVTNAVCVDQLLNNGARCLGKTVTDEMAYSLIGENEFYGTPINPQAPDRVPGGSSSGSASAVACGLCDFALGTDTAGSIRVPASQCGIWGVRPSFGLISVAGVRPLAQSLDTVGVLTNQPDRLVDVLSLLTGLELSAVNKAQKKLWILSDVLSIADVEVSNAVNQCIDKLSQHFTFAQTTLAEIVGESFDYQTLFTIASHLHTREIASNYQQWVAEKQPSFGAIVKNNMGMMVACSDRDISTSLARRRWFTQKLTAFLGDDNVLCFPTTSAIAPKLGAMRNIRRGESDYYDRIIGVNAMAGLAGLPQVSFPVHGVNEVPVGFSLLSGRNTDLEVTQLATHLASVI